VPKLIMLFLGLLFCMSCWAMRDPTMPANARNSVAVPSIDGVDMVLISGGRRVAVINGNFVSVGDVVAGNKILEITPNSVILENTKTGVRKNANVATRDVKTNAQ
jgi:hypothetical protein